MTYDHEIELQLRKNNQMLKKSSLQTVRNFIKKIFVNGSRSTFVQHTVIELSDELAQQILNQRDVYFDSKICCCTPSRGEKKCPCCLSNYFTAKDWFYHPDFKFIATQNHWENCPSSLYPHEMQAKPIKANIE